MEVSTPHLLSFVALHATERPGRIALGYWRPGGRIALLTYRDLYSLTLGMVRALEPWAARQEMIPILMGRNPIAVAAMLAATALDRPFCFINPRYRAPQIDFVLRATQSQWCLVDAYGSSALRDSAETFGLSGVTWLCLKCPREDIGESEPRFVSFQPLEVIPEAVGRTAQATAPWVRPRPDVTGAVLFTSGSTGRPKGVRVSQADLVQRAFVELQWFNLSAEDSLLGVLPFSFDVGLNQLCSALVAGAELVLLDSWLPKDILTAVQQRAISGISAVPTLWHDFLASGLRMERSKLQRVLRYVTVSGGSLPRQHLERLEQVLEGTGIFKTYGQTEAFRTASLRPEYLETKPDSVGQAYPEVCLYVVDEHGRRCRPGQLGEVVHTGLGTMLGYLGEDACQDERKLRRNPYLGVEDPAPRAVFTGDIGWLDEDGFLYLKGRQDEMIKVRGNRVYPQEVVQQLLALPAIVEAAVVGKATGNGDHVLVAFVVRRDPELQPAAIRRWLNQRLPAYMVPERIVFVRHLPRGPSGKTDVQRLLGDYLEGLLPEERPCP